ncbi:3-methyladenine DNA glycosylase [Arthrobacter gengyunqii]|uniref:3-methyladenine DNA glycosylase n=1 Tax=Arthrobacter gengyunqii TaxID=2886940 RepID=A0A9X1LZM6_9MICC|nr:3-methyladenine DNA glycosylase [Arthrobacter gengyunqii]MCC3268247.1 3-methyladenine DNA glycosylase [Arthrobacter gengyunqii]UOY95654.1 3-methyladenine DNA glycosylase [Arthrobacter gengyunqii]
MSLSVPVSLASGTGAASGAAPGAGAVSVLWESDRPYRLDLSLGVLAHGRKDPSVRIGPGVAWLAFSTPEGNATLALTEQPAPAPGARVLARAWGPGAEFALAGVPALLGDSDDWSAFDQPAFTATLPAALAETRRRNPGLRLPSTGRMLDSIVPVILEQKVTAMEAYYAWRYLVTKYGADAPGPAPAGLKVPPSAEAWRRVPSWEWHRARVDFHRSGTILRACGAASALERLSEVPLGTDLTARLCSIPGIGPWSAAEITQRTHGAPDSVSVGDYHLSAFVGEALTGRRTDDAGMLALLEPWRGHRQRVVRLLVLSGFRKQAFGPRLAPEDHRGR